MVRASYLEHEWESDTSNRGIEPFVPVTWEKATELAARALKRTKDEFSNEAIYGGSYGWGSAGRFHHSQSQLHRFLNQFGGYTYSVASYSTAAAQAIMPHVLGISFLELVFQAPTSDDIVKHTKTMLLFGGAALKNTQVNAGGLGAHTASTQLQAMHDARVRIVCGSPLMSARTTTACSSSPSGGRAGRIPTSPSCWAWPTRWSPKTYTTRRFLIVSRWDSSVSCHT